MCFLIVYLKGEIYMSFESRKFKKILAFLLGITSIGESTQNYVKSMESENQGLEAEKSTSNDLESIKKTIVKDKDTEKLAYRGTQQDLQSKVQKFIEENPGKSIVAFLLTIFGIYKIGCKCFENCDKDLINEFDKGKNDDLGDRDEKIAEIIIKDLNDKDKKIAEIIKDLRNKSQKICDASSSKGKSNELTNTWKGLEFLLGKDATKFVKENYPEWENRLTNDCESNWRGNDSRYERFALMSMAYSLRLASIENYDHSSDKNNELLFGENLGKPKLKHCNKGDEFFKQRLKKVIVEDNDILRSAHGFILKYSKFADCVGVLNAGDPYEPNGFLPNRGSVLEEYLSMTTTLVRDLSGREFRKDVGKQGFYTTRKNFPPICNFDEQVPSKEVIMKRLTGTGRDFYHERGIMSRNVHLIRDLGNLLYNDYQSDPNFPFRSPYKYLTEFNPPKNGIGNVKFRILSIAGLEDRSGSILDTYGKNTDIYKNWEKITKKQCEFVLKAFIKEGVKVPFLCAFGAGAFGGKASMVAQCWRELLIDEGYIDYFDYVVFPIGYNGKSGNYDAFRKEFENKI